MVHLFRYAGHGQQIAAEDIAMLRLLGVALVSAVVAAGALGAQTSARAEGSSASPSSKYRAHKHYRRGPQVRGYVSRGGGYSYSVEDAINPYGDSRSRYGGTSFYRDPRLDTQTNAGPFDHGFFFDSGINPRGGNSPYPN